MAMTKEEQKRRNVESARRSALANPERTAENKRLYSQRHPDRCEKARILWKDTNPEKHISAQRKSHLLRKYGMTPEKYAEMDIKQSHLCAICGEPQTPKYRYLDVDHDHRTGKNRGLLCRRCNIKISVLESSPEWMEKALAYLGGSHEK